ncbi:MAG TPA: metallophosphoesterase [Candidatus Limnocylindrales bacterium]|nr:metallophosphoesterase [Candidatus Limnocylindrales bacterium]
MTRRLRLTWPDRQPFLGREGRPIRILAASDEPDPTLDAEGGRQLLGAIDLVVGCGDLAPDRLAFLADAFGAPLVYVRGNHDRGAAWQAQHVAPEPTEGLVVEPLPGLSALGLPWPGRADDPARRDDLRAWRQTLGGWLRAWRQRPCLVFSHAPPAGSGDLPADPYHLGFPAYRFLLERLSPPLWLHGHTPLAGRPWHGQGGPDGRTAWANVTGSVLVELLPPDGGLATIEP